MTSRWQQKVAQTTLPSLPRRPDPLAKSGHITTPNQAPNLRDTTKSAPKKPKSDTVLKIETKPIRRVPSGARRNANATPLVPVMVPVPMKMCRT